MSIEIEGVDHVAFGVSDQARSIEWYSRLLGLREAHEEWERHPAMLMTEGSGLALFQTQPDEAAPGDFRHLAFRVTREQYVAAKELLASELVTFRESDHRISHSIYFSDPDGIRLELTTYELA